MEQQAIHGESKNILGVAGLDHREWAKNDPEIEELTQNEGESDARPIVSISKLRWDTALGISRVAPKELETGAPRKKIIQQGLTVQFDLPGLMTPITIKAKILMKKISQSNKSLGYNLHYALAAKW